MRTTRSVWSAPIKQIFQINKTLDTGLVMHDIRASMKTCGYCGAKTQDDAAACSECGSTEFETPPAPAPAEATPDETLAVLKVFSTAQAADVAAATLRANGIDCTIVADDGGGMLLNFQATEGVRVCVAANRLEDARELLASTSPD